MLRARKSWIYGGASAISAGFCLLLATAASAASPSLSVAATDAVIGQTIDATAQLSEAPSASGEISFEVFGPGDPTCSGPALTPAPASASVSGEGEYTSGDFTPSKAGVYHWSAHYSGDLENPEADSPCSALSTVGKASPGLSATASSGGIGAAIHDEATVSGGFHSHRRNGFRGVCTSGRQLPDAVGDGSGADPERQRHRCGFCPSAGRRIPLDGQLFGRRETTNRSARPGGGQPDFGGRRRPRRPSSAWPPPPSLARRSPTASPWRGDSTLAASSSSAPMALAIRPAWVRPNMKPHSPSSAMGVYAPPGFSPSAGVYRWTVPNTKVTPTTNRPARPAVPQTRLRLSGKLRRHSLVWRPPPSSARRSPTA